ncbi:MAG: 4-oxalocrotonate tautomerase DmpI [Thermodesulfovibrionales bacterium]|nr:4-oxalocrotonate tautomerase DmpI [Thermodesulfovibrionales bacterium]
MPTVTIEGPPLPLNKKRELVSAFTDIISRTYEWPAERVIVIIHENHDENVARGGVLLSDREGYNLRR